MNPTQADLITVQLKRFTRKRLRMNYKKIAEYVSNEEYKKRLKSVGGKIVGGTAVGGLTGSIMDSAHEMSSARFLSKKYGIRIPKKDILKTVRGHGVRGLAVGAGIGALTAFGSLAAKKMKKNLEKTFKKENKAS